MLAVFVLQKGWHKNTKKSEINAGTKLACNNKIIIIKKAIIRSHALFLLNPIQPDTTRDA